MDSIKRERDPSPTGEAFRPLRLRLGEQANFTHEDKSICLTHASCLPKQSTIDPTGDLTLIVGQAASKAGAATPASDEEGYMSFTVSAQVLSKGSKVFERMLFGEFATARKPEAGEEWILRLPDDNPRAMANLLNIMHLRFDKILPANQVTTKELYNITILTDKYDVDQLLRPWASTWLEALPSLAKMNFRERCQCLWITWVIGDLVFFENTLGSLARHCRIFESRTKPGGDPSYEIRYEAREPPGITNIVMAHRLQMIRDIIKPLAASVNCLIDGQRPDPLGLGCRRVEEDSNNQCNAIILGSLIKSLSKAGLWPLPSASELCRSKMTAMELRLKLCKLDIKTDPDHDDCYPQITKKGHGGLRWSPKQDRLGATDAQRQHLAAQALKTGVVFE